MAPDWNNFLRLRIPAMLVVIALAVEGLAWSLRDTQPMRHPLDRLVFDIAHFTGHAPVVLLGDSVTQDVAGRFRIGTEGQVANLTTNQASGTIGDYFLLRRYLARNSAPRMILLAGTPEALGFSPQGATASMYVTSVFQQNDERDDIIAAGISPADGYWKPAILRFEADVFDRLVGLFVRSPRPLPTGDAPLDTELTGEPPGADSVSVASLAHRRNAVPTMSPGANFALARLCSLAAQSGSMLYIAWAPIPETVYRAWQADRRLSRFADEVRNVGKGECAKVPISNLNDLRAFPDHAFRDPDHLRRRGWGRIYARLLDQIVRQAE